MYIDQLNAAHLLVTKRTIMVSSLATGIYFYEAHNFLDAPKKIASFSQLPAVKKAPLWVQLQKIFGLFYFVTALGRKFSS